jgi:single-strand DNA-binding protein
MNKVILIGNLTRDPELRYTPGGAAVCEMGIAVNRKYQTQSGEDREETTFVDITVWGRQGETADKYLSKGRQVCIEGRLKFDSWETQDGQKRNKLSVVAERVIFLGGGGGGAGGGGEGGHRDSAPRQSQRSQSAPPRREPAATPAKASSVSEEPAEDFNLDDIPF